ncbi:hypothetical protein F1654_08595 [Alkalicaulis satelles]|uniref:DUF481 domain-containing protein n=1 Tax=Alkalicaulis satelles TaxID=2609175 RepID=A0A5M6ZJI5_9PROT|nr:hypothetical protein [Alkalicaulis satelles]KAA5803847.1 hypothetical protein F1654_08595 [Alkalicaulis satelles]
MLTRATFLGISAAALAFAAPAAYGLDEQGGVRLTLPGLSPSSQLRLAPELSAPAGLDPELQRRLEAAAGEPGLDADTLQSLREGASGADSYSSAMTPATGLQDTGSASALPWYERFTLAPAETRSVWGTRTVQEFQIQAGQRWAVTLGYADSDRREQSFGLQDFSAGAFFSVNERFRFGGQLRFTSPEDEMFGEEGEERTPEIRFESAFRF